MDVPSDRKIQHSRNLNRFCKRFISWMRTIRPTRRHPSLTEGIVTESSMVDPGSPSAAGTRKVIHHAPLIPTANLRLNVEPPIRVTGTSSKASTVTPLKKPSAVHVDERRDVMKERSLLVVLSMMSAAMAEGSMGAEAGGSSSV